MWIEFLPDVEDTAIHYTFAIILARQNGQWLFVRHKERLTWELPAGHVEPGETVFNAAIRELKEETGAMEFDIFPLVTYRGLHNGIEVYGKLFSAEIIKLGPLPDYEISEVRLFDDIPVNLTYPQIQPEFISWYKGHSSFR